MAAGTSTDNRAAQYEAIHKAMPEIFAKEVGIINKFKDAGDKVQISGRGMRLMFKQWMAGSYGAWDSEGGSLGAGVGQKLGEANASGVHRRVAVEMNRAPEYHSDTSEKAFTKALRDATMDTTANMSDSLNREFLMDGNCILCTVSSGHTTTTLTVDTTRNLQQGMVINSYSNDMTTKRSEVRRVVGVLSATTVKIDGAFAAQSSTDRIVIDQPAGTANPVGIFGPRYYHQSNLATYWHDKLRSDVPMLRTPHYDAGGNALTPAILRIALAQLKHHRGPEVFKRKKGFWIAPTAQKDAILDSAQQIATITGGPNFGRAGGVDPMFAEDDVRFAGFAIEESTVADPTRIDFTFRENWFRGETLKMGLYDVDGRTIFEVRDSTGAVKAAMQWFMVWIGQYFVEDPGLGIVIDDLALPAAEYAI